MGIKSFIGILFIISFIFLIYDIESVSNDLQKIEKPMVSFYDTLSYTIDVENVNSIVRSSEVYLYNTREEMVESTMLLRDEDTQGSNFAKANFVTKINDYLYLDGDVRLEGHNGVELSSEELEYNMQTQIATNRLPFVIEQGDNIFIGERLFFDLKNNVINAKNIQFSLKDFND